MSKALKAVEKAAADVGATDVREEGNTVVVDYERAVIRMSRDMSTARDAWNVVIDDLPLGTERAPSLAFKRGIKIVDGRRHDEAAATEALHNVCADKHALLLLNNDDRVLVEFDGDLVVAIKGAIWWTVECQDISTKAMNASAGIAHVICTLEERAELAEKLADMEEPAEVEVSAGDFPGESEWFDRPFLLTDSTEIEQAINDAFRAGDIDHTTGIDELRDVCEVCPSFHELELYYVLMHLVRNENAPFLALTRFFGGCVETCVEVGEGPDALETALAAATAELSAASDGVVTLVAVGDYDEGADVLCAYRVPTKYRTWDVEEVENFGARVGRYRMVVGDAPKAPMTAERRRRILDGLEPYDFGPQVPWVDTRKVSIFQPVAALRAALETMPVVLHDEGPVDAWGTETYVDIDLSDGTVRLGSASDHEADRTRNRAGITYCIEVAPATPGHRLAEVLALAETEMPAIVAGYDENEYGTLGGLTTDDSYEALLRVRDAVLAMGEREAA